jgi:hypothetical protein
LNKELKWLRVKHGLTWFRIAMSYHKFSNLGKKFNSDLTSKATKGVINMEKMDRPCNCNKTTGQFDLLWPWKDPFIYSSCKCKRRFHKFGWNLTIETLRMRSPQKKSALQDLPNQNRTDLVLICPHHNIANLPLRRCQSHLDAVF